VKITVQMLGGWFTLSVDCSAMWGVRLMERRLAQANTDEMPLAQAFASAPLSRKRAPTRCAHNAFSGGVNATSNSSSGTWLTSHKHNFISLPLT